MKKTIRSLSALLVLLMLVSMLPVQALAAEPVKVTVSGGDSKSVDAKVSVDASTVVQADSFGVSSADGRVAVDKSVTANSTDQGFDIVLSAMGQEYLYDITNLEDMKSTAAADVLLILDLSASMEYSLGGDRNTTRVSAMVDAVNQTISTVMASNPENRVMVCGYGEGIASGTSGFQVILPLASYKATEYTDSTKSVGVYLETTRRWSWNWNSWGRVSYVQTNDSLKVVKGSTEETVEQKRVPLSGGTYIQMGIAEGATAFLSSMKTDYGDVVRYPYVLLLTDGNSNGADANWKGKCNDDDSRTFVSVSNSAYGDQNYGKSPTTNACKVVALTILTAAYQKQLITTAYNQQNMALGKEETPDVATSWYNIGLSFAAASDASSAGALHVLLKPSLASASGSSASKGVYEQLVNYTDTKDDYAPTSEKKLYQYATDNVYFTNATGTLSAAFASLATAVSSTTSGTVMPVKPLTEARDPYESYVTFTDTLGTGTALKKNGEVYAISVEYNGATYTGAPKEAGSNTYVFTNKDTGKTLVSEAKIIDGTKVVWELDAGELPVVRFADRLNPQEGVYESKGTSPIKLCYTAVLDYETLSNGETAYANAIGKSVATATFKPSTNNSYYYSDIKKATRRDAEADDVKQENVTGTFSFSRSYQWNDAGEYIITLGNNGKAVPEGSGFLKYNEFIDEGDPINVADYMPVSRTDELKPGTLVTLDAGAGNNAVNDDILETDGENAGKVVIVTGSTVEEATKEVKDPTPPANMIFVGWKMTENDSGITLTAQYAADKNGDSTPDIFQKKITFTIEHGYWTGTNNTPVVVYATLKDSLEEGGKPTSLESGKAEVSVPAGDETTGKYTAVESYQGDGAWFEKGETSWSKTEDVREGKITVTAADKDELEYKFEFDELKDAVIKYNEFVDNEAPKGEADRMPVAAEKGTKFSYTITIDVGDGEYVGAEPTEVDAEEITLADPTAPKDYIFVGWVRTDTKNGHTFEAKYALDKKGDEENPEDEGNNIPDIFEQKVNFEVIHGTWGESGSATKVVYVPLTKTEGGTPYYCADGSGSLTAPEGMTKTSGYCDEEGMCGWLDVVPKTMNKTETPPTYRYAFGEYVSYDEFVDELPAPDGDNKADREPVAVVAGVPYGKKLTIDPNGGTYGGKTGKTVYTSLTDNITIGEPTPNSGVAFVGWILTINVTTGERVLEAQYEADTNKDKTPDIFQREIVYKITNGTWGGSDKSNKGEWVNLYEGEGASKYLSAYGSGTLANVPSNMQPDAGYVGTSGAWDPALPTENKISYTDGVNAGTGAIEAIVYEYAYGTLRDVTVHYNEFVDELPAPDGDNKADTMPVAAEKTTTYGKTLTIVNEGNKGIYSNANTVKLEKIKLSESEGKYSYTVSDPVAKQGYVFVGWKMAENDGNITLTAQYETDTNKDKTPDIFQREIVYKITNGTWGGSDKSNKGEWVNLYEGEGASKYLSAYGSGTLANVPSNMQPDAGYVGTSGAWDPALPTENKISYTDGVNAGTGAIEAIVYEYAYGTLRDVTVHYNEFVDELPAPDGDNKADTMPVAAEKATTYGKTLTIVNDGNKGTYSGSNSVELVKTNLSEVESKYSYTVSDPAAKEGYVFVGWKMAENDGNITLTAQYADDTNKDEIADIFEKKVTFKVVNGTWGESGTEDVEYAELFEQIGGKEVRSSGESASGTVKVPANMCPGIGYDETSGKWTTAGMPTADSEGKITVSGNEDVTYTYEYELLKVKVTYNEFVDEAEPKGEADKAPVQNFVETFYGKTLTIVKGAGNYTDIGADGQPVSLTADQTIPDPTTEGQKIAFVGWKMTEDDGNITLTAQYAVNDNEDDAPEIFQKKVTFEIVNGTWDGSKTDPIVEWVTLYDEKGKWDPNGTGTLTSPDGMTADANHTQESGAWNVEPPELTPPTTVRGTKTATFIYTFGTLVNREVSYNGLDGKDEDLDPDPEVELVPHGSKIKINPNTNGTYKGSSAISYEEITKATSLENALANPGFTFVGWTVTNSTEPGCYCEFIANYKPDENVDYKKFIDEEPAEEPDGQPDTEPVLTSEHEEYGTIITIKPDGGVGGTYQDEAEPAPITVLDEAIKIVDADAPDGYVFVGWSKTNDKEVGEGGIEVENGNVTYWAHYAEDKVGGNWKDGYAPDGVADLFQATVTYRVENGSWSTNAADTADRYEYVTLKDAEGRAARNGSASIKCIPTAMQPDANHKATPAAWTPATTELVGEVPVGVSVEGDSTFVYAFTEYEDQDLTFNAFQDNGEGDPASAPVPTTKTLPYGVPVTVGDAEPFNLTDDKTIPDPEAPEGKLFMGWKYEPTTDPNTQKITAVKLTPVFVDDENDDKIPDMYQKNITFTVVNGSFTSGGTVKKQWVTLLDDNGKWSKTGTAALTSPSASEMQPDAIHVAPGTWDNDPPAVFRYDSATEYTYTYNLYRSFDVNYNEADDNNPDTAPKKATLQVIYGGKVTIDPNGGLYKGSAEKQAITVTGSASIDDATREGYIFLGWKAGEMEKDGSYTLTAQWVEKPVAPPTGDSAQLGLWSGMMMLALAAMAVVLGRKKRKEN